jgi:hypothetical protein
VHLTLLFTSRSFRNPMFCLVSYLLLGAWAFPFHQSFAFKECANTLLLTSRFALWKAHALPLLNSRFHFNFWIKLMGDGNIFHESVKLSLNSCVGHLLAIYVSLPLLSPHPLHLLSISFNLKAFFSLVVFLHELSLPLDV